MRSLRSSGRSMLTFVCASLFCSLMTKVMVTRYFFDYPIVILMMQSAATLFVVEISRVLGVVKVAPYSFEKGRQLFLPSILYTISQWITVASFEGISMPNYDSIKRFTPLFIILGISIRGRQQKVDPNKTLMILGICVASAITVNLELNMDRYSFFYGVVGAGLQAAAFLIFEENMQSYSSTELLYMHSFNSLVFYLLADIVQDEIRDAFMYMITAAHPLFIVVFVISMIGAIIFHWTTFTCLEKNGTLNMQIASNLKASAEVFIAYYLSLYLFYDVYPGIINWLFLIITIVGARALAFKSHHHEQEIVKGPWISKA